MGIINKGVLVSIASTIAEPLAKQLEKLGKNSGGLIGRSMIKGGHKIYYHYNIIYRLYQGKPIQNYKPQKIPDRRAKSFFNYFVLEVLLAYVYVGYISAESAISFYWERKYDLQKREQVEKDLKQNSDNLRQIYEFLEKQENLASIGQEVNEEIQKTQKNHEILMQIYEKQQKQLKQ